MDCYVLDRAFNKIDIVENFTNLIWTERFSAYGDFELYISSSNPALASLIVDNYLKLSVSDVIMIIEQVEIVKSREEDYAKITGRSYESIFERRVIEMDYNQPPTALELLFAHVSNYDRTATISTERVFEKLITDRTIPAGTPERDGYEYKFKGSTLYEVVKTICDDLHLGFRIDTSNTKTHVFSVYMGKNRTSTGTLSPAKFSIDMQNINTVNYVSTGLSYKNVAIVDMEPSEFISTKYTVYSTSTNPRDLERREMLVDGSNLKSIVDTNIQKRRAETLGYQELRTSPKMILFEADLDTTMPPHYGVDYNMGDFVEVAGESIGVSAIYRVSEYIRSYSASGLSVYPTFELVAS